MQAISRLAQEWYRLWGTRGFIRASANMGLFKVEIEEVSAMPQGV